MSHHESLQFGRGGGGGGGGEIQQTFTEARPAASGQNVQPNRTVFQIGRSHLSQADRPSQEK